MNGNRTYRSGNQFLKQIDSNAKAEHLLSRTDYVRNHGVVTPEVSLASREGMVSFPFLNGRSGLDKLLHDGPAALAHLLEPLGKLHLIPAVSSLKDFDALAKVKPRLRQPDDNRLIKLIELLDAETRNLDPKYVIHGDFHINQLLIEPSGKVWLLDLDDLGRGPKEADLGNFSAHLATRAETREGRNLFESYKIWSERIIESYSTNISDIDPNLVIAYGRVALVRRGLKLREIGDPSVLEELVQIL